MSSDRLLRQRESALWRHDQARIDPPEQDERTCDCDQVSFCDVCGTREDFLLHESDRG